MHLASLQSNNNASRAIHLNRQPTLPMVTRVELKYVMCGFSTGIPNSVDILDRRIGSGYSINMIIYVTSSEQYESQRFSFQVSRLK
jgi:hypothetical protein